jgi:hypothetical protein
MRTFLAVFALTLICPPAFAQTTEPRGSAAVVVGPGRTWDDEGSLGTGPVGGGRVEWRLFGNTRVEAAADFLGHERTGGFFEAEGLSTIVGASLVQRFGTAVVQPYVLGGYSIVRHSGSITFEGVRRERSSTGHGYQFGTGLAVRVGSRFEIGPEVRFYMIQPDDDLDPALAYWVGLRAGVTFPR